MALRRIREGLSPLSSAIRTERVYGLLNAFGEVLGQEQLDALPAGARAIVTQSWGYPDPDAPIFAPVLMRHALIERMRVDGQVALLVELPLAKRKAQLDRLWQDLEQSWNPLVKIGPPEFSRRAAGLDKQRAQTDLLLALALVKAHRAESGSWPATLPTLYPERKVLLPTALMIQPGEAGTLVLVPEEAHPQQLSAVLDPDEARLQELAVTATP